MKPLGGASRGVTHLPRLAVDLYPKGYLCVVLPTSFRIFALRRFNGIASAAAVWALLAAWLILATAAIRASANMARMGIFSRLRIIGRPVHALQRIALRSLSRSPLSNLPFLDLERMEKRHFLMHIN